MNKECKKCYYNDVMFDREPCLTCSQIFNEKGLWHTKFVPKAVSIRNIIEYANGKVGPAHTVIFKMLDDMGIKYDKDK